MLVFIIIALLLLLLLIITFYFFHANQHQKQELNTKKVLSVEVDKFKLRLKNDISVMVASKCISQKQGDALYRVANYYFVYQSMTSDNVASYSQLMGELLTIIKEQLFPELMGEDEVSESTQDIVGRFIHSLPARPEGFSPSFYRSDLPVLLNNLSDALTAASEIDTSEENLILD